MRLEACRRSPRGTQHITRLGLFLALLMMLAMRSRCYKIGSPVPLLIRTPTGAVDSLRNQMPLFGIPTWADIGTPSLLPGGNNDPATWRGRKTSISLTFGGGSTASFGERVVSAPWVDVFTGDNRALEKLTVTFVYSRDGDLHSVSSRASYVEARKVDEDDLEHFHVEYVWIEEADVDLVGGLTVMMGTVLLVCLVILVRSCGSMGQIGNEEERHGRTKGDATTVYGAGQDFGYGGYTGGTAWKGE